MGGGDFWKEEAGVGVGKKEIPMRGPRLSVSQGMGHSNGATERGALARPTAPAQEREQRAASRGVKLGSYARWAIGSMGEETERAELKGRRKAACEGKGDRVAGPTGQKPWGGEKEGIFLFFLQKHFELDFEFLFEF
jgi:hypothetical protein